MKYLALLLLSVLFIPIIQVAHAQNIIEQIGEAFNNLTSGTMGGNETNQTSGNGSSASSGNETSGNGSSASSGNETSGNGSSASSGNATSSDIGSFSDLQNLTSGNQEMLANNTDLSGGNTSLGQGMEQEQYVEPENQSNALSGANSTQ